MPSIGSTTQRQPAGRSRPGQPGWTQVASCHGTGPYRTGHSRPGRRGRQESKNLEPPMHADARRWTRSRHGRSRRISKQRYLASCAAAVAPVPSVSLTLEIPADREDSCQAADFVRSCPANCQRPSRGLVHRCASVCSSMILLSRLPHPAAGKAGHHREQKPHAPVPAAARPSHLRTGARSLGLAGDRRHPMHQFRNARRGGRLGRRIARRRQDPLHQFRPPLRQDSQGPVTPHAKRGNCPSGPPAVSPGMQ